MNRLLAALCLALAAALQGGCGTGARGPQVVGPAGESPAGWVVEREGNVVRVYRAPEGGQP